MKDSYSFDLDDAGLQASYDAHRAAYISLFDRLGLPYVIVSAMSGAMGGSASEEFLAPMDVGEDTFVRCTSCDYAANIEAVVTPAPPAIPFDGLPAGGRPRHAGHPDHRDARRFVNSEDELRHPDRDWTAADTLKNVVVKLRHPDGTIEPLAIGVPGDREVDMKRLEAQVAPAEPEPFTEDDFAAHPAARQGLHRPGVLGIDERRRASATSLDPRVVDGTAWITGADRPGHHVIDLVAGRDFTADGTIEAAEIRDGDVCPVVRLAGRDRPRHRDRPHLPARAQVRRGARARRAGRARPTRSRRRWAPTASASRAASPRSPRPSHDDLGLVWPREIAPADVHIVIAGKLDGPQFPAGERSPPTSRPPACECCSTTATAPPPASSSRTPNCIGIPTIVVVGRGVADESSSHDRGQGPPHRRPRRHPPRRHRPPPRRHLRRLTPGPPEPSEMRGRCARARRAADFGSCGVRSGGGGPGR